MFTYTNKTSNEKFNFTVQAETKKELFKAIEEKLGGTLDPEHKRIISRQLKAK